MLMIGASFSANAQDAPVRAEGLINSPITTAPNHDMLMTRVHISANTVLPMHSHPTEEFLYILGGEAILRIQGREDQLLSTGAAVVIPAGEIHTAITHDSDAVALTTRVQPKGQPVRIPAPKPSE
jgi:quercetin dioxygenase-like cupin family protein